MHEHKNVEDKHMAEQSQSSDADFIQDIESCHMKNLAHTWHSARAFAKGEPIPAPESSEYIESAEDDRKDEQTALCAYSISATTPSAHPTLKVTTWWRRRNGQTKPIEALIDTGSNTSLVQAHLLSEVVDRQDRNFVTTPLTKYTRLVAASGSPIRLSRAATLDFDISDSAITHCFYIVDSLPIDQPLILGMDFLVRNHARIDIVKG